jgi:hypothetical protein
MKLQREPPKQRALALAAMKIEKKDWDLGHFGQGKEALTKEVTANMREALERLKLRAPELPPHIEPLWGHFVEKFPSWFWKTERGAPLKFLNFLKDIQEALGRYYIPNPLKPEKRRKTDLDHGNPDAFSSWVQRMMDKYGTGRLKL